MAEEKTDWGFIEEIPKSEEEWKKELWYGPDGMYEAGIRRDKNGNIVEVRNITKTKRSRVASPTISVYAGMFFIQNSHYKSSGKLVLHKRPDNVKFPGDWELLGGGISAEANALATDERIIAQELVRVINAKTDFALEIKIGHMPAMYPAVIKGGSDWAFVVPVWVNKMGLLIFGSSDFMLVSPQELLELANGPEGNRLLSGYGKRMHRLALKAFQFRHYSNDDYRKEAERMLIEIHDQW